jgi:drug/metabolite transporter (DMT)-like permease
MTGLSMKPEAPTINYFTTIFYTLLALVAFAANSVLCRMALELQSDGAAIDAGSFTIVRLVSGIVTLMAIFLFIVFKNKMKRNIRNNSENNSAYTNDNIQHITDTKKMKGSWLGATTLFLYAFGFSYAYVSLETGTGALILFGVVQITMILVSIYSGHKLVKTEWLGIAIAFLGFIYLVLPGVSAPSLQGLLLMSVAGIAWGFYTVSGRASTAPLTDTAFNFLRTTPFIIALVIYNYNDYYLTNTGLVLAIISGAITSGFGYTIWYAALRGLKTMQAAVLQLLVPIIAAVGGVIFVSEPLTERLIIASVLILGGIGLVILGKRKTG